MLMDGAFKYVKFRIGKLQQIPIRVNDCQIYTTLKPQPPAYQRPSTSVGGLDVQQTPPLANAGRGWMTAEHLASITCPLTWHIRFYTTNTNISFQTGSYSGDLLCCNPRGGTSSNVRYPGSACKFFFTQSDLRFCENERLKRFKINEKGGQLDYKLRKN